MGLKSITMSTSLPFLLYPLRKWYAAWKRIRVTFRSSVSTVSRKFGNLFASAANLSQEAAISWRRLRGSMRICCLRRIVTWEREEGEMCKSQAEGGITGRWEGEAVRRSIGRKIFEIPGEPRDDSISQRPLNGPLWTMRHRRPRSFSVFEGRTFFAGGRLCRLRYLFIEPTTKKSSLFIWLFLSRVRSIDDSYESSLHVLLNYKSSLMCSFESD